MTHDSIQLVLTNALAAALVLLTSTEAQAGSGTVTGNVLFYQNQGSFCPYDRDCTGAKYTWEHFGTNQPLRNARVYVVRQSDNAFIGQGTTDAAGFFAINWTDPSVGASTPTPARLLFYGEHADGRFVLRTATGGWIAPLARPFTAVPGFSWIDFTAFGDANTPNDLANLYDGAHMMWHNSLSQSSLMQVAFNGLEIRAYDATTCPTSCADGPQNRVIIDSPDAAYNPQSRILHEMGHIADYEANTNSRRGGDYNFGGDGGWYLDSPEWASAGWAEAIATHAGDVALYFPSATEPHTCYTTAAACTTGAFDLEASGSCAHYGSNANRIVLNNIRYHWDLYDELSDTAADVVSAPAATLWDTLAAYPNTTENRGINEHWAWFWVWYLDDLDGRGPIDYQANWDANGGPNTTGILNANCGGAGD